jgi:uncharacterized protein YjiS (DUF1127 family)
MTAAQGHFWWRFQLFLLIFSVLSYAYIALLRRNIGAFLRRPTSYVPGRSIHRPGPGRRKEVTTMFASIVRFVREWRRYNSSMRELSRLGDRELADIGISRSDIARVSWTAAHQR